LPMHTNELCVTDVDRSLLALCQERARERAAGYELCWWDGPYPEEVLDDVVWMKEGQNSMPRGELDLEDEHHTSDHFRQQSRVMGFKPTFSHTEWQADLATVEEYLAHSDSRS